MVTVTKATLGRNAVYFIAEVLRNNLSDTHSTPRDGKDWIFKSQPTDPITKDNLPRIVLENSDLSTRTISLDGTKYIPTLVTIDAVIYTGGDNVSNDGALADRDKYADEIREILFNPDSEDSNGTSLKESGLILRTCRETIEDFFAGGHPKIVRSKRLTLEFKYYGG